MTVSYVAINPRLARVLGQALEDAAGQADDVRWRVATALGLADLSSHLPTQLALVQDGVTRVAVGVTDAATEAEQYVMPPPTTTAALTTPVYALGPATARAGIQLLVAGGDDERPPIVLTGGGPEPVPGTLRPSSSVSGAQDPLPPSPWWPSYFPPTLREEGRFEVPVPDGPLPGVTVVPTFLDPPSIAGIPRPGPPEYIITPITPSPRALELILGTGGLMGVYGTEVNLIWGPQWTDFQFSALAGYYIGSGRLAIEYAPLRLPGITGEATISGNLGPFKYETGVAGNLDRLTALGRLQYGPFSETIGVPLWPEGDLSHRESLQMDLPSFGVGGRFFAGVRATTERYNLYDMFFGGESTPTYYFPPTLGEEGRSLQLPPGMTPFTGFFTIPGVSVTPSPDSPPPPTSPPPGSLPPGALPPLLLSPDPMGPSPAPPEWTPAPVTPPVPDPVSPQPPPTYFPPTLLEEGRVVSPMSFTGGDFSSWGVTDVRFEVPPGSTLGSGEDSSSTTWDAVFTGGDALSFGSDSYVEA